MFRRGESRVSTERDDCAQEAHALFQTFPSYDIERYMGGKSEKWRNWTRKFLQFFQRCSESERQRVAQMLIEQFSSQQAVGPKDLFVLESLWDFGHESEMKDVLPDVYRACMRVHQERDLVHFERVVLPRFRSSTLIPRELRMEFDPREPVPSNAIVRRQQQLEHDKALERQMLLDHGLPEDIDEMVYALQKMAKGKIGLPTAPDFLARVIAQFSDNEQFGELQHVVNKLKHKQSQWFSTQQLGEHR